MCGTILIPERIGDYCFQGIIGKGSFSIVLVAVDSNGARYACKIISKILISQHGLVERFETEVRVIQQLHHPAVIQLFDILQDDNNFYLILELCSQGALSRYIVENQRLDELEARYFLKQILEGISYCHSLGVVHRDLKPENILLGDDGHLKIADFGFSRFVNSQGIASTPCGSLCYAAPECFKGGPYDGRLSDSWSIGIITFAMLAGELPWTERSQRALCRQIEKGDIAMPEYFSQQSIYFIANLVEPSPEKRNSIQKSLNDPWIQTAPSYRDLNLSIRGSSISLRAVDRFFGRDSADFIGEGTISLARSVSGVSRSIEDTLKSIGQKKANRTARITAQRILYRGQKGLIGRPHPPSSKTSRTQ